MGSGSSRFGHSAGSLIVSSRTTIDQRSDDALAQAQQALWVDILTGPVATEPHYRSVHAQRTSCSRRFRAESNQGQTLVFVFSRIQSSIGACFGRHRKLHTGMVDPTPVRLPTRWRARKNFNSVNPKGVAAAELVARNYYTSKPTIRAQRRAILPVRNKNLLSSESRIELC